MLSGSLVVLFGAFSLTLPPSSLSVFGFAGGRTLPVGVGGLLLLVVVWGATSPSRLLRPVVVLLAIGVAAVAIVDTARLDTAATRGAGMGLVLVGALIVLGGTLLRRQR
jgi:hypothetical protein